MPEHTDDSLDSKRDGDKETVPSHAAIGMREAQLCTLEEALESDREKQLL